jgi:phosphate transport system permease protein
LPEYQLIRTIPVKGRLFRFFESIIEGLLLISGSTASLIVLLIVLFLFKEGIGLFQKSTIEEGSVLVISSQNPVNKLAPQQLKHIFDQEITNWEKVGGKNDSIILFRIEDITNYYSEEQIGASFEHLPVLINRLLDSIPGIIAFVPKKYTTNPVLGKIPVGNDVNLNDFISGKEWFPTAQPSAQLGVLPLVLGTILVSLIAILLALPLGLAVAVYMAEIADERMRKMLKPVIELLAGIPSVVYGFFGLIVIVPLIQKIFDLPVGETGLAGAIVLAIMALPTIITITEDALRTTPMAMREASLALGASKWQTIYKVVIPYSISGITAAAILGIGRAVGETMAVLMVTGNAAVMPHSILEPLRTIPATIAAELGEAPQGGLHYSALFMLGCILFVFTLIINLTVEYIGSKRKMLKR